jgi:hypothetical protein
MQAAQKGTCSPSCGVRLSSFPHLAESSLIAVTLHLASRLHACSIDLQAHISMQGVLCWNHCRFASIFIYLPGLKPICGACLAWECMQEQEQV